MANANGFPSHMISTKFKGYEWILKFVRAAWNESRGLPNNYYYTGNNEAYNEKKMYALGKQSTARFVRSAKPTAQQSTKQSKLDYSPTAILCKFREQLISKLLQREYDIVASAVDELSRTEQDDVINKLRIKIEMREQLRKANSPLADSPLLMPQQGEPKDMEELMMQKDYSFKHVLAEKMELGVQFIFQLNNMVEMRKRTVMELFDIGLAGYKVWIDDTGLVRLREVVSKNYVTSFCFKNDYSDSVYRGEVTTVPISELMPFYAPDQIKDICDQTKGLYGNPTSYVPTGRGSNVMLFKVLVWDMDFDSWNSTVYEGKKDEEGNVNYKKTDYKNIKYVKQSNSNSVVLPDGTIEELPQIADEDKGESEPVYKARGRQVIYKASWIVGTDKMHNWGLKENMVRKKSTRQYTHSDYYMYAWNFFEMQYTGILERLIPIANRYQQKVLRLQDLNAKLVAYMIYLDLDAIDSAALAGKGGTKWTQQEIIDMAFQDQLVVFRSQGIAPGTTGKPLNIEATGQLQALAVLYQGMVQDINEMYEISGANQITANSPDPKQNEAGINVANQNTNNAIYLLSEADKTLQLTVADAIAQKLQCAVQLGKIQGYVPAIGTNATKYFELTEDITPREFGIAMADVATKEEKAMLLNRMVQADQMGLIPPQAWPVFERIRNLSQAEEYLAYQIQKGKDDAHAKQMELVQQQTQGNAQVSQISEAAKQKTIMIQHQCKMEEINLEGQWQMQIESGKKAVDLESSHVQGQSRVISSKLQADAKVATSQPKLPA